MRAISFQDNPSAARHPVGEGEGLVDASARRVGRPSRRVGTDPRAVALMGKICESSPLARGTLGIHWDLLPGNRFIPARAGNTLVLWLGSEKESVHPRSRGEHSKRSSRPRHGFGSSPLARGTPTPAAHFVLEARFIPARAGNTSTSEKNALWKPVHPRSRGEHPPKPKWPRSRGGSSPLARGTLRCGST